MSNQIESYKCNNFQHLAKYCKLTIPPRESQQNKNSPPKVWKMKNESFTRTLKAQKKKKVWFFDSGFSIHMIGIKINLYLWRKEMLEQSHLRIMGLQIL